MSESAWGLHPCPFCGGTKLYHDYSKRHGLDGEMIEEHRFICDATQGGCGASCGWQSSEMEAVDAWNRRANTVDAIPVKPLAQWLAGYAAPPAYALDATRQEGDFISPDHMTRAWEHHLHTLMENGLMEEEKSE